MEVHTTILHTWPDVVSAAMEVADPDAQWIFRGLSDNSWTLKTSLERAAERIGIDRSELPRWERGLVRKFQRHFHLFDSSPPHELDEVEWLAVMQHHGSPTRLLDWTYSFFAGLYFALENATSCAALWAVNLTKLEKRLRDRVPPPLYKNIKCAQKARCRLAFLKAFRSSESGPPFVSPLSAVRLNQRLIAQQSVFLCHGDLRVPFETSFGAFLEVDPIDPSVVRKWILDLGAPGRREAIQWLHRMNINAGTLYPGLDGFARSLNTYLAFPVDLLDPKDELEADTLRGQL